uniref:Uncharacterized protein n=1 Tax=Noccaea caerulescens TaxID=107243 RepID=A0A1J3I6T0_NOCCA
MGQRKLFSLMVFTSLSWLLYHYIHHVRDDEQLTRDHFDCLFHHFLKLDAVYHVETLRKKIVSLSTSFYRRTPLSFLERDKII